MIIQHDPNKPNEVISIDQASPHRLVVAAFRFPGVSVPAGL